MSLGAGLLLCSSSKGVVFCFSAGSCAVWSLVLAHHGFYLMEKTLSQTRYWLSASPALCHYCTSISCRQDNTVGFVAGLVFMFLFWCAEYLVPKTPAWRCEDSREALAQFLYVQ